MFLGQEYAFSFIVPFIFSQHKCFISAILNFINNMLCKQKAWGCLFEVLLFIRRGVAPGASDINYA